MVAVAVVIVEAVVKIEVVADEIVAVAVAGDVVDVVVPVAVVAVVEDSQKTNGTDSVFHRDSFVGVFADVEIDTPDIELQGKRCYAKEREPVATRL